METYEKAGFPKGTGRVVAEGETKVLELHDQHADWGKHRLVDEIAKANNWVQSVFLDLEGRDESIPNPVHIRDQGGGSRL